MLDRVVIFGDMNVQRHRDWLGLDLFGDCSPLVG
jgi:hypothetical protein